MKFSYGIMHDMAKTKLFLGSVNLKQDAAQYAHYARQAYLFRSNMF